jgi:putative flippase GtrA
MATADLTAAPVPGVESPPGDHAGPAVDKLRRPAAPRRAAPVRTQRPRDRRDHSRAYNRLLKLALRVRFTDARCGFKGSSFAGQAVRFAAVGVASTVAYLALYVLFRLAVPAEAANAAALLLTALANTAANRRFTFDVPGRNSVVRHHVHGLALFAAGLALSSAALTLLHLTDPAPGRALEVTVLVVANLVTTALRFVAMRWWVFAPSVRPVRPARPVPVEEPR